MLAGWRAGTRSRRPRAGAPARPGRGSSTSGVPCSITAFMIVHQHTPNSSATCDTGRAFSPTWRHASIPARRVITACASTWSECSVHVFASHSVFAATPPPLAPHQPGRTTETREVTNLHRLAFVRLRARSRTPRIPSNSAIVSIVITSSSVDLDHLEHPEPVKSQQRFRQPDTVAHAGVSSSSQPSAAATMTGPLPETVDPLLPITPYTNAKSH